MAENKKSFTAYCDWNTTFNSLPDDKAGQLIKHLLSYVNDENPETNDLLINAVFASIKATLKRDLIKWEAKSEKNKESALIRWNKSNANECERIERNAKHADSVSDSVSDSDIKVNNNLTVDWVALLKFFNDVTGRSFKVVSAKAKKQIKDRLKEGYSKEDLVTAINNCFNDKYHQDNRHYLTLEFISRSDKMEKFATDCLKPKLKQDRL
jgi:uncharacterized phage protein (TIGR02220 family)